MLEDAEPTKGKAVSNKEDEGAADDWIEGSMVEAEEEGCNELRREEGVVAGAGSGAAGEEYNECMVWVEGEGGEVEEESGTM